jgi:hypothetical protein
MEGDRRREEGKEREKDERRKRKDLSKTSGAAMPLNRPKGSSAIGVRRYEGEERGEKEIKKGERNRNIQNVWWCNALKSA